MEAILARRYEPLNFLVIRGFPNPVLSFSERTNFLNLFCGDEGDNPAQHLIDFHQRI
jgi:hypothetical protein